MAAHRFDELTKALATGASRRRFLKTFAAGTAGGVLSLFAVRSAAADPPTCRGNRNECPDGSCCPRDTTCCPIRQGNRVVSFDCCSDDEVCTRKGCRAAG